MRGSLEEGIRGEVEGYRAQLEGVKAELAPWEAQMKEVQVRAWVEQGRGQGWTGGCACLHTRGLPCCTRPPAPSPPPWSRQSRIDVAASERDLLTKQHEDAKQRYEDAQVSLKAAQETARNKAGQIKEMEAAVDKYRWARVGSMAGAGWQLSAG